MVRRTKWDKVTKFKVAIDAIRGEQTTTEIAEEYGVDPSQVTRWKQQLMEHGADVFEGKHDEGRRAAETERDELYRKVGHQQIQIDFLKKKLGVEQLPSYGR
jgi:transposase-like protein